MHVQIIVSRKDITNKIKLSQQNTSRGKNTAHSQKLGQFDRTAFKQSGETLFDFERNLKNCLQYANTMKKGTAQQKAQMHTLTELTKRHPQGQPLAMELAHDVAQGMFGSVGEMLATTGSMAADLLGLLMAPVEGVGEQQSPTEEEKKRRKWKRKHSHGLSDGEFYGWFRASGHCTARPKLPLPWEKSRVYKRRCPQAFAMSVFYSFRTSAYDSPA